MKNIVLISIGLLFLLFAYFQLNDPDPVKWIPIYLIPAFFAFKSLFFNSSNSSLLLGLAIGYFLMAILQWPNEFEGFLFGEMQMRSVNIELAREAGGLSIASLAFLIMSKFE